MIDLRYDEIDMEKVILDITCCARGQRIVRANRPVHREG